jgi:hypothetical protein
MAENLTVICEPTVQKMWEPRLLHPMDLHGQLQGYLYLFTFYVGRSILKTLFTGSVQKKAIYLLIIRLATMRRHCYCYL